MEKKDNMPLWVFLAFANIEKRKSALILFWSCLAFSFICIPLSYYLEDWSWAAFMFPTALWYWLALKWVDKNSVWA
ncbi:MAG: hypothetical protein V3V31_11235 [Methylococcales bacterium]